jgi:hypothetical protein
MAPPAADAPLRAPRAAAIAGILFSTLLIASVLLVRWSIPYDPRDAGAWLATRSDTVALALNLVPFSGVAFLWFIGVLRDRLGAREDRLFSTVFFGSGLLFLAMLFFSAATTGSLVLGHAADPARFAGSQTFAFGRLIVYEIFNIYAIKMAAVFMVVTSTLALRTRFLPRWVAVLGYGIAALLVLNSRYIEWLILAFPGWVLLVSLAILWENLRRRSGEPAEAGR